MCTKAAASKGSLVLDVQVEKVYAALRTVIFSFQLDANLLKRPPFSLLHKIIVELVWDYGIYQDHIEYKQLSNLTSKELKAGFLTKALAWTAFVHQIAEDNQQLAANGYNIKKRSSVLLLVSPVKVLAGLEVEKTLEFLIQLVDAKQVGEEHIKQKASQQVFALGEAALYTLAVKFRSGLTKIQARGRGYLVRKGLKRSHDIDTSSLPTQKIPSGTIFYKESENDGVFEGIVRTFEKGVYNVYYPKDDDEEELDEAELELLVKNSNNLVPQLNCKEGPSERGLSYIESEPSIRFIQAEKNSSDHSKPIFSEAAQTLSLEEKSMKSCHFKEELNSQSESHQKGSVEISLTSEHSPSRNKCASTNEATVFDSIEGVPWQDKVREKLESAQNLGGDLVYERLSFEQLKRINQAPQPSLPKLLVPGGKTKWRKRLKGGLHASTNKEGSKNLSFTAGISPARKILDREDSEGFVTKGQGQSSNFPKLPAVRTLSSVPNDYLKKESKNQQQECNINLDTQPSKKLDYLQQKQRRRRMKQQYLSNGGRSDDAAAFTSLSNVTSEESTSPHRKAKEVVSRILNSLEWHLKRRHIRLIDFFHMADIDKDGFISSSEMITSMNKIDLQLTREEARVFISVIDADNNGLIDCDELEAFLRINRRQAARREHLEKEASIKPVSPKKYKTLLRYKRRLLDVFKALDTFGEGLVSATLFYSSVIRLDIKNFSADALEDLIKRCKTEDREGAVEYTKLCELLNANVLENKFIDNAWLNHFDARLENVLKEYDVE